VLRGSAALAVVALLGLSRDPGCGGGDSPAGAVNAPCTRSKDCAEGLVCSEGVCTAPDSGAPPADGGPDDAQGDGAQSDGG